MNKPLRLLRGISHIGIHNTLRTILNARVKASLDKKFHSRLPGEVEPPHLPGRLLEFVSHKDGASIQYENADLEITFLHDEIVRFNWIPGSKPIPYAIDGYEFKRPDIQINSRRNAWELIGSSITVQIDRQAGILLYDAQGKLLRYELPPLQNGTGWIHRGKMPDGAAMYGLGERASRLNLKGGAYRLWNLDPGGRYGPGDDPVHMSIPVYVCLHDSGSYLLFYENSHDGTVSFKDSLETSFLDGALRYYFIAGTPARAIELYSALTGRPPLPPQWSLGFHQSRWGYASENDIREVVKGFQEHNLPISAVHLDIDYMDGYRVFTIDQVRFPDLKKLSSELAESDIKLVAILDPGVKIDPEYSVYRDGLAEEVFCSGPDGEALKSLVWPGWVHFPDFTNQKARAWWGSLYPSLLEKGISGFWHDMNEPAAFVAWGEPTIPLGTLHNLDGRGGYHTEAHNFYALKMNQAGFEALELQNPGKRPFLLTRSGFSGIQRYAWNWTGDTASSWDNLKQSIITMLGIGLSGVPYTGSDIGGFDGDPEEELLLRWFQMAAFTPFFRTHSVITAKHREPWRYSPEVLNAMREVLNLRYELLPYIYTLAWEATRSGAPLMRPLFWSDPSNPALREVEDQFLLGDHLLVAPVVERGAETREVLLPRGTWFDYWTAAVLPGGSTIAIDAPLSRIPVFVREGTILPLHVEGKLVLKAFPVEGQQGLNLLYSDAGDGFGVFRVDAFTIQRREKSILMEWQSEGEFEFPYQDVRVEVPGLEISQAYQDGQPIEVSEGGLNTGVFTRLELILPSSQV